MSVANELVKLGMPAVLAGYLADVIAAGGNDELVSRLDAVEGDIEAIDGRVTAVEGDVEALDGRVTTLETPASPE